MNNISIIINAASISYPGYQDVPINKFIIGNELYDNIFIGECLSYIEYNDAINLLFKCIDQLNPGGSLIVQNFDIVEIAEKISIGQIEFTAINQLLSKKISFHSLFSIVDQLTNYLNKCSIEIKDIDNLNFIIHIRKNV